jgi:hypothetical protein
MNVGFWNVQRLGYDSDPLKADFVGMYIAELFAKKNLDYLILCEVTSDIVIPGYDVTIEKTGHVVKKGARKQAAQLGYACLVRNDADLNVAPLEVVDIRPLTEIYGGAKPMKGAATYGQQGKRQVVRIPFTSVYAYHCNSSSKAPGLMTWVAASLALDHPKSWLMLGDFNCDPNEFTAKQQMWATHHTLHPELAKANWWAWSSPGPTHNAKAKPARCLDWVIHAPVGNVAIHCQKWDQIYERNPVIPDHLAIWVSC